MSSVSWGFLINQLWQQFAIGKFEMFLHVMAVMRSGENGMVTYIFPHKVPHSGFGQKKGKENVKGKKNMIMYIQVLFCYNFCEMFQ